MKKKSFLVAGYCFCLLVIYSCGLSKDNKAAQATASEFYTALKAGDISKAANLCETDQTMTTQAWQELFSNNLIRLGNITAFEKGIGFNVSIDKGVSTVILNYNITYEKAQSTDSLSLVDTGNGFKIFNYAPVIKE